MKIRIVRKGMAAVAATAIMAGSALPANAATVSLIPEFGSTWKVWDQGASVFTTFMDPATDESTWKTYTLASGKVLGYGDTDVQAPALSFGSDTNNKHTVTYFRASFNVTDPAAIDALELKHLRDDGTIIYLNGVEVLRSNMPSGPVTSSTFSTDTVDGVNERLVHTSVIPADQLVAGNNVLAIQLHQRSASSSDIGLRLSLTGEEADEVPLSGFAPTGALAIGLGASVIGGASVLKRRSPRCA